MKINYIYVHLGQGLLHLTLVIYPLALKLSSADLRLQWLRYFLVPLE